MLQNLLDKERDSTLKLRLEVEKIHNEKKFAGGSNPTSMHEIVIVNSAGFLVGGSSGGGESHNSAMTSRNSFKRTSIVRHSKHFIKHFETEPTLKKDSVVAEVSLSDLQNRKVEKIHREDVLHIAESMKF